MIKKFNKLMDDIPLILKLIIGVLMCAILTLMGLILFFFFLPEVNAAAVNPNSNEIYAEALNGDNPEYINIGQNQEYSLSIMKRSNLFVSNFINLGTGVYKGTAYVKYFNLQDETCSQLKQATNRVTLSLNNVAVNGTINIPACTISDHYATIKIEYSYTNMQTNGVFKLIYRLPFWNIGTKFLMNSTLDYEAKDYATNTDIENQTISIINNAIQNAAEVINTNILSRQAIIAAMNAATTQIQNALNNQNQICDNNKLNKDNLDIGIQNAYLNETGQVMSSNTWNISKKYKINENKQLTYKTYSGSNASICFYENNTLISCQKYITGTNTITIPNNANYVSFSYTPNATTYFDYAEYTYCEDRTKAEIDAIDNMNITISTKLQEAFDMEEENAEEQKGLLQSIISGITGLFNFFDDDDVDDPDNALGSLNNNMGTNNVISSLLLLPVTLYQSVVNNINGTCNSFNLGSLYNHNLTMTCIQPQNYIGSTLWGVIDVLISGLFVLHIRKRFVDIFNHLTSLRTGGNELE